MTCYLTLPPAPPSAIIESSRSGASEDAKLIRNILKKPVDGNSIFWGQRKTIQNEIEAIYREFSYPGWDGYDAFPIERISISTSLAFVQSLPNGIIAPELAPESDGGIALDWRKGENMIFSISVKKDLLVYAGIFGENEKTRGEARLENDECPHIIEKILTRYFSS